MTGKVRDGEYFIAQRRDQVVVRQLVAGLPGSRAVLALAIDRRDQAQLASAHLGQGMSL